MADSEENKAQGNEAQKKQEQHTTKSDSRIRMRSNSTVTNSNNTASTSQIVQHRILNHTQHQRKMRAPIDLPQIDTRVKRANIGESVSMPSSPTSAPNTRRFSANLSSVLASQQPLTATDIMKSGNFLSGSVQGGKMTKLTHYGRLRSVTARVLRMMDPRAIAQRQNQHNQQDDDAIPMSALEDTPGGGTAAGVLGRSFVDTMRDAAVKRRRRHSHSSIPPGGLSRHGSRDAYHLSGGLSYGPLSAALGDSAGKRSSWRMSVDLSSNMFDSFTRNKKSIGDGMADSSSAMQLQQRQKARLSGSQGLVSSNRNSWAADQRQSLLSPVHSDNNFLEMVDTQQQQQQQDFDAAAIAAANSVIAIPMPGFFLDPASDDWVCGHSFCQRMRYPNEVISVPASLTKRVHYEVSYDYPKNAISTARYNLVTFFPAQLAAQFSKIANVYFLFIAALQQVPGWSTTGRWSTVLPLCIFVSLSIAHEGFDDLRRHRMDYAENTQRTRVLKVKVHDKERVSFNFKDFRHRGSQSIHSFRMRSSQSIHDIGRSTIEVARNWATSTIRIGSTVKENIISRIAEKRRKQRELEESDDEDEDAARNVNDPTDANLRQKLSRGVISLRSWRSTQTTNGNHDGAATYTDVDVSRDCTEADNNDISLAAEFPPSGRGSSLAIPHRGHQRNNHSIATSLNDMLARESVSILPTKSQHQTPNTVSMAGTPAEPNPDSVDPSLPPRRAPMVAFNDVIEEMSNDGEAPIENPLPDNMSCRWKRKRWENVQVGDMLMIVKDDWIPADCIVLASTGFDGTCFVETAALDGETTLKQKQALDETNSAIQTAEQLAAFNAFTYVEPPSAELYNFEGYMEIDGKRYPLTPNQLLLRGSVLRNTAYIFAQVVYSGEQTRLRLNATRNIRTKAPQIQRITNKIVISVFILLLILCFVFSALGINWNNSHKSKHWYLSDVSLAATALIFGYIVMMNALIPISLYVTLEAVKIFQCWFIQQDISMYHAPTDTYAEARTTAINEDLGMVQYVFSDKTGTLTENIMKLRAVMISGFSYLHIDLDRLGVKRPGMTDSDETDADAEDANPADNVPPSCEQSSSIMKLRSPIFASSQSPGSIKSRLFGHKRQYSLPPMTPNSNAQNIDDPKLLHQLAVSNRINYNGTLGPDTPKQHKQHFRGASVSALRSPNSSIQFDTPPRIANQPSLQLSSAGSSGYGRDLSATPIALDREIEAASDVLDTDTDPDLVADGDDPHLHTKASEDAPVSDLHNLPSTRKIMVDSGCPPSEVFRNRAEWFLRCMALCHTVQPDRDPLTGRITGYQATSPDEKALVAAAAELGFVMNNRTGPLVQLRVVASERMRDFNAAIISGVTEAYERQRPLEPMSPSRSNAGEDENNEAATGAAHNDDAGSFDRGVPAPDQTDRLGNYEVLDVLEFSSARKRMSVIYRCPDGRIVMMSKGADSAIWPRLVNTTNGLESKPDNASYLPIKVPTPKVDVPNSSGLSLRRTLSRPSAAYLHSRNSSVASTTNAPDFGYAHHRRSQSNNTDLGGAYNNGGGPSTSKQPFLKHNGGNRFAGPAWNTLAHPPRTASRLGDELHPFDSQEACDGNDATPVADLMSLTESDVNLSYEGISSGNMNADPYAPDSYYESGYPLQSLITSDAHIRPSLMSLVGDGDDNSINIEGQVEIPDSFESPSKEEEEWARARALEALHQFSTEGLRTLVYAHKEIPQQHYESWHQKYLTATTALSNRQIQVEHVCEEIERDLLLTGVSAIEDRLQDGVPETIFKLRRAGIRVWMLTGDKVETAINIAKSCRLVDTDIVETTTLSDNEMADNKDRMMLLVMQSMSDPDKLEKLLDHALKNARMLKSVDERFERRTRMQKLMRGLKSFGNKLDPRRIGRLHKTKKQNHGDAVTDTAVRETGRCGTLQNSSWPTSSSKPPVEHLETPIADPLPLSGNTNPPVYENGRPISGGVDNDDVTERASDDAMCEIDTHAIGIHACENAATRYSRAISVSTAAGPYPNTRNNNNNNNQQQTSSPSTPGDSSESRDNNGKLNDERSTRGSLAVVIDGETLAALEQFENEGLLDKFLSLGTYCDAVICSRVSPAQKALVVHHMRVRCEGGNTEKDDIEVGKKKKSWIPLSNVFTHDDDHYRVTVAIGDGGNDIAMIQEAHVGIGIAGQEGLQASRAADFSIAQFRFLQKLLLVHGRWSYVRVSLFIMGTFYKCMAFYVTQLIFQFYTGFSGTSLFESWTLSMYNTLFSLFPVLLVGIFEQDLKPETLLNYPELYRDMGPKNHMFTVPLFIRRVVVIGIIHSVVAAYFPFATDLYLGYDAASNDMYITGFVVFGIMVLIATIKISYVDVRRWTMFSHIGVILTLTLWFGWNGVLNHIYPKSPGDAYFVLGVFHNLMTKGPFWFQWIIFVGIAICIDVLIRMIYSIKDPVENRIMSWFAFERNQEHIKHKAKRNEWVRKRLWDVKHRGTKHRRYRSHIN